MQRILFAIL